MPFYEYVCDHCGKEFATVLSVKEHDRAEVRCPGCDSKDVRRHYGSFVAHTSKKS